MRVKPGFLASLHSVNVSRCSTILRRPAKALFVLVVAAIGAALLAAPRLLGDTVPVIRHHPFVRGDSNGDGLLSIADIFTVIRFFHDSRTNPPCSDAADFDDSGVIDITDVITLVKFMFLYGELPPRPYPEVGFDLTADPLDCVSGSRVAVELGGGGGAVAPAAAMEVPCEGTKPGQEVDFIHFLNRRLDAYPGQKNLFVPIAVRTRDELEGFTLSVHADPLQVWLERFEFQGRALTAFSPEWTVHYTHKLRDGYLASAVFMDYAEPFEEKVFPKKVCDAAIANLVFSISPEAKAGDLLEIHFDGTAGLDNLRPSFVNEFSVRGRSVIPEVDPFGVTIAIHPKNRLFLRGDSDRDEFVNITDAILVLRYLFLSEAVSCLDPLDVDDEGDVNITDAILLVNFLFNGGSTPPPPFQSPGLDPTQDSLGNCPIF